jgi:Fe2+ transport system protein FeoA
MSDGISLPLVELRPGETARVLRVPKGPLQARLASLGLVPDAVIELLQAAPAVLLRIGATSLALERELGAQILVRHERERTPGHDGGAQAQRGALGGSETPARPLPPGGRI